MMATEKNKTEPPKEANTTTPPPNVDKKEPPVVLIEGNNNFNDEQDEEVRRLALALAPQVQELDQLLTSPPPLLDSARGSRNSFKSFEEDDGMNSEEQRLEQSEELLRQELEFAQDWSRLMASPLKNDLIARELAINYGIEEPEEALTVEEEEPASNESYTLQQHAETLGLEMDGGWYILESKLATDVLEYVVPLPVEQLKRLYIGLIGGEGEQTLAVDIEQEGAPPSTSSPVAQTTPKTPASSNSRSSIVNQTEPLPVRTIVIWIRADVLCGAVMDAVYHSLDYVGQVTKRQGGHLTGIVSPCTLQNTDSGQVIHCPGFSVDVQLCTYKGSAKNKQGQRSLILRIYHYFSNDEVEIDDKCKEEQIAACENADEANTILLKEAAALVQKMETGTTEMMKRSSFVSSLFSPSKLGQEERIQDVISQQLLSGYRPCPSVLDGRLTLPALSEQDAPVVHASWRWIDACWNELENRDLSYSTLNTCRFGAFPALPTLDVHYCSQLRRLSREGMIVSLLKSASELEEYAREAEYTCANLIQMLRPTFHAYEIEPPALPQPLPLTAYPLDFTSPQSNCPPWGMKVMEALNRVSAMTSEENTNEIPTKSSYELGDEAIQMVLKAFQKQDDEEQGARLGRKNVQVMDRLAKMQAHKRASIGAIRDSYGRNLLVVQAADEFHIKAQQASSAADEKSPEDQVPLYKCSVLVRSSTGTLYVTSTQILFVTKFIPIVGGQKCTLFDLEGLEFGIQESSSSLLMSPLPTSISVTRGGEELYSFRPSHGAHRLVAFLKVVQAMANPDDEELTFSDRGGLLYMYGDSPPPQMH
jgi:hypothetical protein